MVSWKKAVAKTAFGLVITATALTLPAVLVAAGAGAGAGAETGPGAAAGRTAPEPIYHTVISVKSAGTSVKDSTSNNWSGYNQGILEKDTPFTSISGTWVVPTATQHTPGQAEDSATWIGIGGGCLDTSCTATDSTLIQAGTEQDVAANGTASYSAWWELVPVPSVTASITVHPGDTINCSISQVVPGLWDISLSDATDGQGFTETLPYASDEATAEWIEETPVVVGTSRTGLAALPNLGSVQFTNAQANGAPASLAPAEAIQLTDSSGNPIATPSTPVNGTEFDDCTWATTCAAP